MSTMRSVLAALMFLAVPAFLPAAEQPEQTDATKAAVESVAGQTSHAAHAEHGIPQKAQALGHQEGFVTNSMLVTWLVALGLILFARIATRQMQDIPTGAQNFWEWLVEGLYDFLEGIIGHDLVKKTFWFFATIFIFILFTNWFGLIPGVGTIGWGHPAPGGGTFLGLVSLDHVKQPLLRPVNAYLNMTFAMAGVFMVLWLVWALQSNGIWGFTLHIFGPKGESTGFIKYFMIVIFFAVGFLELISIAFRPISLSFRLYGNVFAGDNLLEAMSNAVQHPAWARSVFSVLLPVPFYFLEILVGLVQAFVFMLLTTVFTALI